ncbi:MAG TPA: magnesium transporter [Exilispira sp.]|nr:magnesium transporter [Exilispira sp.]
MEPIRTAITEGRLISLKGLSKEQAIRTLCESIEKSNLIPKEFNLQKAVLDRESLTNTYLGFNIACPHARIPYDGEIICSIGYYHEGIIYNNSTNDIAKLIILLLIPQNKSNEYLNLMAKLIKFLVKFENLRDFENIFDLNAIQSRILEWIYIIENPEDEEIEAVSAHANTSLIIDMILPDIEELIESKRFSELQKFLNEQDPVEIADIINLLTEESSIKVFRLLTRSKADEVFSLLEPEAQNILIQNLAKEEIRQVISSMASDDRTTLFEELPAKVVKQLLELLDENERKKVLLQLNYPEDSVGRLISNKYIAVTSNMTVGQVLNHIRNKGLDSESIEIIYVVNEIGKLIDDLPLRKIILADPATPLEEILDGHFVALFSNQDKEEAAQIFKKYDMYAMPVVDSEGILIGIVTNDDIIDVVEEEATEDFHKGSAILPLEKKFLNTPAIELWKRRISWLIILVFVNIFSGAGLAHFENLISSVVALVFFLPLLVDSGGNAGSQSATLVIRSMALGELTSKDFFKAIAKELLVSLLLGVSMGVAVFILGVIRANVTIGLVVAISMTVIITVSSLIGLLLPFLFHRFGMDPAVASGPLITSLADIMGIILYMNIASFLLKIFNH